LGPEITELTFQKRPQQDNRTLMKKSVIVLWHVWETGEVHIQFWSGGLRERGHLKNRIVDRRILLKWVFIM
jgi:hypothetical protein